MISWRIGYCFKKCRLGFKFSLHVYIPGLAAARYYTLFCINKRHYDCFCFSVWHAGHFKNWFMTAWAYVILPQVITYSEQPYDN